MRAIKTIFTREFGAYVRSPVGWILAALNLAVTGILFQSWVLSEVMLSADALAKFFWLSSGVTMITAIILSFRLITEDRQNHAMVLLNTAPITETEIILGKYLAALAWLTVMLLTSLYLPLLIKVNGKLTGGQIFVGYLGLFLLGAASLAIGTFASALTRSWLIALAGGFMILVVMVLLFPLAKRLDPPLKDLLSQLDLWWLHFQNAFMKGIFNLKDVVYYLAVTYFFLLLSVKTLEAKRWH